MRQDDDPDHERVDDWRVIPVEGDLDFDSAERFGTALAARARNGDHRLVLDLGKVAFMDSSGLRVLLRAARETRARGGELRLAAPNESVLRLLEVTQVGPLLPAYPDIRSACDGPRGGSLDTA